MKKERSAVPTHVLLIPTSWSTPNMRWYCDRVGSFLSLGSGATLLSVTPSLSLLSVHGRNAAKTASLLASAIPLESQSGSEGQPPVATITSLPYSLIFLPSIFPKL